MVKFYEELKKLQIKRAECIEESEKLAEEERSKLEYVYSLQNEVEKKYSNLRREINKKTDIVNSEISKYCLSIKSSVSFDIETIGRVLADLISAFEKEEYLYQGGVCYHTTAFEYNRRINRTKYPSIIVAQRKWCNFYLESGVRNLRAIINAGDAVMLMENGSNLGGEIVFYQFDDSDNLIPCVDFGRFTYAKDFIDELIDYRIECGIDLDKDAIEDLRRNFISSKTPRKSGEDEIAGLEASNNNQRLLLEMIARSEAKK